MFSILYFKNFLFFIKNFIVSIRYHEKIKINFFFMGFYFVTLVNTPRATPSKGGVLEVSAFPIYLGWLLL
jgi:hypothetical protein